MTLAVLFADISLSISADTVAWYGAILATIGSVISLYNLLRDRAKIKLWYSFDNKIIGEFYEKGKEYLRVDVTNLGRRPIKVTHVGGQIHGESKTMLFSDSFQKQNEDRILTEQNPSVTYITDQDEIDRKRLWYVFVIDARGREYRTYPTLGDRLKMWIYLPKRFIARHFKGNKK